MPNEIKLTVPPSNFKKDAVISEGRKIDADTLDATGLCIASKTQIIRERELIERIIDLTGNVEKQKAEIKRYTDQIKQYNNHKKEQISFEIGAMIFSALGTGIIVISFSNIQSFNFLFGCLLTILAIVCYILAKRYPAPALELSPE